MKMCKCGRLPRTPSGFYCKLCSGERNRQRGHLKSGSQEHRERMRAAMLRRLQDQEATDRRLEALRATMTTLRPRRAHGGNGLNHHHIVSGAVQKEGE